MSTLGQSSNVLVGIPADLRISSFNQASIPSAVRNGDKHAQQAYVEGLAFEQLLLNQLSSQLARTMTTDGVGDPLSTDGATGAGGGAGASSADGAFAGLIPPALTGSIMSAGGLGIAAEVASALDPSLAADRR